MSEPATVEAPPEVFRVARSRQLLSLSKITPEDAALPSAGNRYDVPGGGVLYCGTTVEACFAETLARFRPNPKIRDLVKDEKGFMVVGGVPQDWRLIRCIGRIGVADALPFLDVEDPQTHDFLSEKLAAELVALGYDENLDISTVTNSDRRLSRLIAQHAYTATDDMGELLYSGIRYMSRINSDWECWAIFEGTPYEEIDRRSIELNDPDFQKIVKLWGLRPF